MRRLAKCLWQIRWARIGAGCALVLIGLILGLVPFLPGFLLGLPGLAILAREFPRLKKYGAPFERVISRLKRFIKRD